MQRQGWAKTKKGTSMPDLVQAEATAAEEEVRQKPEGSFPFKEEVSRLGLPLGSPAYPSRAPSFARHPRTSFSQASPAAVDGIQPQWNLTHQAVSSQLLLPPQLTWDQLISCVLVLDKAAPCVKAGPSCSE